MGTAPDASARSIPTELDIFLRPQTIAVVGASRREDHIARRPLRYLRESGFAGEIFVVHPTARGTLETFPVVSSLAAIPVPIDVVLCLVPAPDVLSVLRDAAAAGARGAVVIASGFEGEDGRERREEVQRFTREQPDLRIIGPNCVGVLSAVTGSMLTFSSVLQRGPVSPGRLGLVTQSGAIGNGTIQAMLANGTGVAHWISTGDEVDIGALEATVALLHDEAVHAVTIFLEGITDPENLPHLATAIRETGKPVVAYRATSSQDAGQAAFGHTGRLLGDSVVGNAALIQAGVHLVETLGDLVDASTALSVLPKLASNSRGVRVGVVTVSGGSGVIVADAVAHTESLTLARFSGSEAEALQSGLGLPVLATNPLDVAVLDAPEVFARAVSAVAEQPGVDAVIAVVSSLAHDYDLLADLAGTASVPVLYTHLSPADRFTPDQARRLVAAGHVPVSSQRGAVEALDAWGSAALRPSRLTPAKPPRADVDSVDERATTHGLVSGAALLSPSVTAQLAPTIEVATEAEALDAGSELGLPVVIKAEGSVILHRTEAGVVSGILHTDDDLRTAYHRIVATCEEAGEAVVVQKAAPPGLEVMVSVQRDPEVGVFALARPGGVLVELLGESTLLTVAAEDWERELRSTQLGRLLAGYRGTEPSDLSAIVDLLQILCAELSATPDLVSIEANPVRVHPLGAGGGLTLVDLLVAHSDVQ